VLTSPATPITGEGYEVGLKFNPPSGHISSTISVYRIEEYNLLQTVNQIIGGVTASFVFQGTQQQSQGVDLDVTWSPVDNWQVLASATEDDVRFVKEPAGYAYYLGSHPIYTAKTLANLWTRYTFPHLP